MGEGGRRLNVSDHDHDSRVSSDRPSLTIATLERWVAHGARWRAVEVTDERAIVELCTCYGEPVDMLQGSAPELIEFVRRHRDED